MFKTDKKTIMLVVSQLGGGTSRHVLDMANAWESQGYNVLLLETYYTMARLFIWSNTGGKLLGVISWPHDRKILLELLKAADIALIHYHHFFLMHKFYYSLATILQIPFYVTLNDYFTICPFIKLFGVEKCYCDLPDNNECNKCLLVKQDSIVASVREYVYDITLWRQKWMKVLLQAEKVFVPHSDVKKRFARIMPNIQIYVLSNPEIVPIKVKFPSERPHLSKIRVGVIGALDETKGTNVVLDVAKEIEQCRLPIELVLFGRLIKFHGKLPQSLKVLGSYDENTVYQHIVDNYISYFLFVPLWPETYSYTLSIPIKLGIPILGTNIGAVGAR